MIPYNIPALTGDELDYIKKVYENNKFSGDGEFARKCHLWFEQKLNSPKALLTPSCTHALEMAAILADIKEGDEVIMPSFTFTSTANAFVLRGAKIIFAEVRKDTLNIDEKKIAPLINFRTKAIVVVHYAGVPCEMDAIKKIAKVNKLIIIEDAAQAILSKYKDQYAGTIGDFGCLSFHETKNIQCGEGGALLINNLKYKERAEIIREKGTNRAKFFRGEIDKYSWVDLGSSYLISEINAAFLYAQLLKADQIIKKRLKCWDEYLKELTPLAQAGHIELPFIPDNCTHNGHIFYIKCKDGMTRDKLIAHLHKYHIKAIFHYIPLHSSQAGQKYGADYSIEHTYQESVRLLRLPLYSKLSTEEIKKVVSKISIFYNKD